MYTECPSCKTVFKITANHLKIAHGKVRCGSCSTVFNALDSLIENYESSSAPVQKAASAPAATTEAPVEQIFDDVKIPGMELASEEPLGTPSQATPKFDAGDDIFSQPARSEIEAVAAESDREQGPTGADDFGALDLTGDLDGELGGAAPSAPAAEQNLATDFGLADLGADAGANAGPDVGSMDFELDFGDEKTATDNVSRGAPKPETDELADFLNEQELSVSQPEALSRPEREKSAPVAPEKPLSMGAEFEPRLDEPASALNIGKAPAGAAEDYVLQELGNKWQFRFGWVSSLFWLTVIVVLLVVLVLQFAYFKRADLAKYPTLRPLLEQMCSLASNYVDCTIPLPSDVHAIDLMDRDVRSHPNKKNALLITSTILNKAAFTQPFPVLQITFSDINQKVVAAREFQPSEYLSKDVDIKDGMKASVPIKIMLEIVDPGPEAVNFEFIFKPKTDQ